MRDMRIYTPSQINLYLKELFETDFLLQDIWLEGEISNFTQAASGHAYFTLKDETSQIRCVLWRSQLARQAHLPRNGQAAVLHGRISVYEAQGTYQCYVDLIQPAGVGLLHLQFEALKARLQEEGLFAAEHKRPLPAFPRRLGIVTSPVGAALQDMLNVLRRRYPLAEVILAPSLVQGEEAPPQLVSAIQALNEHTDVEVIIVARGGGSLEELWAFNDERVARAIYASRVPVVSGVGHEVDFTIADFVADLRAPTPSAAAEMATPDQAELRATLGSRQQRLARRLRERLEERRMRLEHQRASLRRLSPRRWVENARQRVDDLTRRALACWQHDLTMRRERLQGRVLQLQGFSPLLTLERGYSITRHLGTGQIVKSVAQVRTGDGLEVQVSDGKFEGVVGRTKRRAGGDRSGRPSSGPTQLGLDGL